MREPRTFVNRSAGPPALVTRSVISAISRCGSTSAETSCELAVPAQMVDPVAQVVEGHGRASLTGWQLVASQPARCGLRLFHGVPRSPARTALAAAAMVALLAVAALATRGGGALDRPAGDGRGGGGRAPRRDRGGGRADADPRRDRRRALHVRPDLPPPRARPRARARQRRAPHPGRHPRARASGRARVLRCAPGQPARVPAPAKPVRRCRARRRRTDPPSTALRLRTPASRAPTGRRPWSSGRCSPRRPSSWRCARAGAAASSRPSCSILNAERRPPSPTSTSCAASATPAAP